MGASPSLARYRVRAERVIEDFKATLSEEQQRELTVEIQLAIHEFVVHDMEWAALAVEAVIRGIEERYRGLVRPVELGGVEEQLREVVESLRDRGR
jgi:hypothetical protein